MRQVVLLPGIHGSGPAHWQTRWERAEPDRFHRFAPSDWDHPLRSDWMPALDRAVRRSPEPPLLVAHSLSCLLVPLWAAQSDAAVAGAVLVAPVDPESAAVPADALDLAHVVRRPLRFPALVVGSRNDPYATAGWSRDFAADLGADHIDAGTLGHINADSGLGRWPWGQDLLDTFAASVAEPQGG